MGMDLLIRSLSGVAETFVVRRRHFACPAATHSTPGDETGRSTFRSLYTLLFFVHVFIMRVAGFALCYGESNNLL